ncbi:flagellin [Allosphingosinicella sp.]|uniref:flagellin N-terminal helical domain-containing protein n=1 Tax=Allosphingosinicella sp. TaxID=2823234 RepID=UPI003784F285
MISGTRYRLDQEISRQLALSHDVAKAQTQLSTQKRIQSPSEDPVAAARISTIGRAQANDAVWKSNLDLAGALADRADTALKAVGTAFDRATELMTQGATGTLSDQDRATIALELRSIADELTSLKDSKDARGNALFMSGYSLRIPVQSGVQVIAVGTREDVFESAATAGGPKDLAAIVSDAAAALEITDPTARQAAVATSVDEVAAGVAHVSTQRGEQGALANRVDALLERQADSGLQLGEERSGLEDTDIQAVVARLSAQQLSLQAAQAVFARVNQSTLFDILR